MSVSKQFDDILTSPVVLWIISLAAAVVMWFYVMNSGTAAMERRKLICKVEYLNLSPQLLVKSPVNEVQVEVEGTEGAFNSFRHDSVTCEIDVKGLSAGKYRPQIKAAMPQNLTLVDIVPSEIDIELIRHIGRLFTVEVALPQDIPDGQYLEGVEVVPKEISLRGTERDLAKVGGVTVAPTLAELAAGKELLLPVTLTQSEPFDDDVMMEPSQIKLKASLVRGLPKKKVPVNVRLNGKPSSDFGLQSVTTDPSEVMIEGAKKVLDAISAIDTEAVDISNISEDQTIVVPLRPLKEKGAAVVGGQSVNLSIKLEPIAASKQFSAVPITVRGADGVKWFVHPAAADVTIETAPSKSGVISQDSIALKLYVNVANLFVKSATLPVRAEYLSADARIVKITPSTVLVSAESEE